MAAVASPQSAASPSPSFGAQINTTYGVRLPFFDGTITEARQVAELSGKYLLVYLHCPTHEDTAMFVTKTLTAPPMQATIFDKVVLVGLSVATSAGHRFALEHHVDAFPALVGMFKQLEMITFQGDWCNDVDGMLREWSASVDLWDTQMAQEISTQAERASRETARLYEENALAEMEREDARRLAELEAREAREAAERVASEKAAEEAAAEALREAQAAAVEAARQEKEAQTAAQQAERRRAAIDDAQSAARARLPAAPPSDAAGELTCVLSVKSLTGRQNVRSFWRTDLVDAVYDFALAEEDGAALSKQLESVPAEALPAPTTWLQLVVGFPPAALAWQQGTTTCGEVPALCPRATVLVRKAPLAV